MSSNFTLNNYNEFLLFLYIHISESDFTAQRKEVELILEKMEFIFSENEDHYDIFMNMRENYEKLNFEEVEKVIMQTYDRYKLQYDKMSDKIFKDLYEIVLADGHVDQFETKALNRLKELIG
ncbi:MAG: TerB family tellurite resistance protein [Cyclobacteriaceae bacterium]|nr:TerB family tellurite resistance protein [Cyclobacteriaceae bacterium]MCH8516476.1 TerB family tellurite resistance protein [Cyclobacteriaceae bacterium]